MGGDSPPTRKKRKTSNGKKGRVSDELTPFEYEGAEFDQFTKQGVFTLSHVHSVRCVAGLHT